MTNIISTYLPTTNNNCELEEIRRFYGIIIMIINRIDEIN
jgi:hypothetical protein